MKRAYIACWLVLLLASCQSVGIAPAKSFHDRLAYAYGVNAGLRQAAASAVDTHTLSSEEGEYVLTVSDKTRTLLDAAKLSMTSGDPKTAEGRLQFALDVLNELQAYLNSREAK